MSASHPLPPHSSSGGGPKSSLSFPAETTTLKSLIRWLTDDVLFHYQRCSRRAFLDLYGDRNQKDTPSDYLLKLRQDSLTHRERVLEDYYPLYRPEFPSGDWAAGAKATLDLMADGVEAIRQGVLAAPSAVDGVQLVSQPDLLIKRPGWSCWGNWVYVPIDIKLGKKPKLDYQVVAAYHAYVLSRVQGVWPDTSCLSLRGGQTYHIDLGRLVPKLQTVLNDCLKELRSTATPELFISHSRCDLCHWFNHCYAEARETRHLSLLPGVTPARYEFLKQQHLTTVAALAQASPAHLAPLPGFGEQVAEKLVHQAQALIDNRAIPRSAPHAPHGFPLWPEDLPEGEVELYFDIEAAPDQNLIYLHGVLVVNHRTGDTNFHALLAETHHQERRAWNEFIDLVHAYPYAPIYHFCPYEAQTVRKLGQLYGTPHRRIEALLDRFFDIHKCITDGVTLPIESYALKHIARWMGFDWRDEGANGAQSICWYNAWAETGDRTYLDAILRYNEDDCRATYHIKDWLVKFAEPYWEQLYQTIG
ncbi:TM0106 family RecB-like putative nuclease [Leptolyngbya sp. CCNP1308]|uniref:TM0106 family RecB-like putative nuclease n=1 Tax=Leptolyngbya sp. CCNP1308 TaxID=3110255 RepID=UPI002B207D8C|nr:TM0106 family RecB-like putative nuclease [Leptolyngbya sp. CCNP1308]MEA5449777.1 TM0106 family RecB-like putative nuclease [Leptolyngbya sp. CCNP1308]